MRNRLSSEEWTNLVAHLRVQMIDEGRARPDFMRAQRATGIDRRTVKSHWLSSVHGLPAIQILFKREEGATAAQTRAPAPRRPVAVPTPTPAHSPSPPAAPSLAVSAPSTAPVPAALVAAPLSPGEAPPTQLAPTGPPPHPLEKIQKAAERALMDEQKILEGQHSLSQGLLVVSSSILVALHESIPEICARIKDRFAENPKEGVTLLRELMEISEKLSKTHGRNVETQRAIAGVPSSHELIVRREGPQGPDPDAEEQRIEDNRLLKNLIKAEALRLRADGAYSFEEGQFIEVEVTPAPKASAPAGIEPTAPPELAATEDPAAFVELGP